MNRALLVGINKYPSQPLNGCVNDVEDMAKFLVSACGFAEDDIRLLVDERATTAGIVERLGWLLTGLRSGDRVLFQYSGHGVQLPTRNPQGEVDQLDEAICPVDFDWTDAHAIRDKDFNKIFSAIPKGVEFIWVSDSCHSGDLWRTMAKPKVAVKTLIPPADINWRIQTALRKNIAPLGFERSAKALNLALISGCRSDQTSADAFFEKPNGALTYFLLQHLKEGNGLSLPLATIVEQVQTALKRNGFEQEPQLDGDDEINARPFLSISSQGRELKRKEDLRLKESRDGRMFEASREQVDRENETLPERLLEALRQRILGDVGVGRFDPDNWSTTKLQKHYEFIDTDIRRETILTVLRESFEPVLHIDGVEVSEDKWQEYSDIIGQDDTPESALDELINILV